MKYKIDHEQLYWQNYKGDWDHCQCPFDTAASKSLCGTWCPHFDIQNEGTLSLTCGGMKRIIELKIV